MGTINETYLQLLDALTMTGQADRLAEADLPADDALWATARQLAVQAGTDGVLPADDDPLILCDLRDSYDEGREPDRLSFDAVIQELGNLGVQATVVHTSGGTATLHAGWLGDDLWAVTLGPGSFDGPRYSLAYGFYHELTYGPTDDDSVSHHTGEEPKAAAVAAGIAAEVANVVGRRQHEMRLAPDGRYADLVNAQCVCGWSASGFVRDWVAERLYARHLADA